MSTEQNEITVPAPLDLAREVAAAMGPNWTARQREYRTDACAEIVNEHGDAVWMIVLDRASGYVRANERGKVEFRASSEYELRDHYPYGAQWPSTSVAVTRSADAMAKAVLRKVVPALVANNQAGRARFAQHEAGRAQGLTLAHRLAAAIGDTRLADQLAYRNRHGRDTSDRFEVGPYDARAEVRGGRVAELTVRNIPADMAERFLREVRAHRDAHADQD